jgi:hypothetical protein
MEETGNFRRVKLMTDSGALVTEIILPKFHRPPEGIMWGQRCFFHSSANEYMEKFIYFCPPNMEVSDKRG